MNPISINRRRLLKSTAALTGTAFLAACGSNNTSQKTDSSQSNMPIAKPSRHQPSRGAHAQNSLHLFASSGYADDPSRIEAGLNRLFQAGFAISNHNAAYRRFQRFAGSDAERIADFQNIASGRTPTPKIMMGVRGGYGAARLLPHINWARLGAKMREQQTLLFGFSDVTAIQLALLAQGNTLSFAGPMLYSDFGKATLSNYTMDSFIRTTTATNLTINVPVFQSRSVKNISGILWGGNLSVLASLAGSPYMPKISGGILFLEDVSEQPYRIERMLNTLLLSGILKQQQAIVLGNFRMNNIRDSYDPNYNLEAVAQAVSRAANIPVYTDFPFGHIANKTTFPLGAQAHLTSTGGGYQIRFSHYPVLDATALNLDALLPPPIPEFNIIEDFTTNENDF